MLLAADFEEGALQGVLRLGRRCCLVVLWGRVQPGSLPAAVFVSGLAARGSDSCRCG